MPLDAISPEDMQALELIDYVMGRFEVDAGFALPGLSASELRPEMARSSGAGIMDDRRMRALAARGLLQQVPGHAGDQMYTLSNQAIQLLAV